ncbi:MAG: transporter substrate-binding protein [Gemmataceae bacterium]
MPQSTVCPTLPEIVGLLRNDVALDELTNLVSHLVSCVVCTDTLIELKMADSIIERLRAVRGTDERADSKRIDSLILTLLTANARRAFSTPAADQTADGSRPDGERGERDWTTLLGPPIGPNEIGTIGPYRVYRLLGTGGMGAVFEAEDPDLMRRVALKVPFRSLMTRPTARERFLREARTAAALKDERIVTIYQVGQVNELPFLAMELLAGETLEARLQKDSRLEIWDVLRLGREIAEGLAVAHDQGLIHRDIKPANIWLTARGSSHDALDRGCRIKILDFGLARPTMSDTHLTATGQILGTPHYMAPEQAGGDPVDQRADLFSLGCVLYEMASGNQAFAGHSIMSVLTALATETPTTLSEIRPELPASFTALVDRLLIKDPAQRPASAWEVVETIRAIEQQELRPVAAVAPPTVATARAGNTSNRKRWLALTAGAIATAISVVFALKLSANHASVPGAQTVIAPTGPPIRVGILHSRTGTMAGSERPVIDATLMAIEEINGSGGLLGSPVEAVIEDGQSDGAVFAQKSEKLITQDKVAAVFGCWTSASRKAVRLVFEKHDHLLLYPVQYEGLEQSPNIVYLGAAPNQQIIPAVTWCSTFLKKQKLFLVGSDYVFPRAANAIIRDQATALGAEIVGEEYMPLSSMDVEPVIQKIAASNAEIILNTINGDTNLVFFRRLRAAGITPDKIPTISFSISEDDLSSFSPKDVAGDYAASNYFQSIDSPQNHAFLNRFQERFGTTRDVSDAMEAAYVGVHLWAQAVRQANKIEPNAVREALKTQSFDAPEGMMRIDFDTQHTEKYVRIGKITSEGRFAVVYCSEQPIAPVPYPRTRPKAEWDALLNDLHLRWGGQWAETRGK